MEKIFLNKKILLTRSLKESKEFKKLLLQANFPGEVIIFPLLEIQYLEPKLELENYDVLIATSLHALKKYKNLLTNSNLNVFSVGKRTNDFLDKQGVNKLFNYKKVSDLLLSLEKLRKEDEFDGNLFLGQALYRQEKWEDSVSYLEYAAENTKDDRTKRICNVMVVGALVKAEEWNRLYSKIPKLYRTDAKYDITLNLTLMHKATCAYGFRPLGWFG